jgi:prepilin-type processing-associated H-X9-DG protein
MNNGHLDDNLIGHVLRALDESTQAEVDLRLRSDPQARHRLEEVRLALEPLAADKDDYPPPPGLAIRTIARIAEYCCLDLPHAPPAASRVSPRSWWRRADFLVAASLLIVAVGLGLPALLQLRNSTSGAAMAECQNNLRVFSVALQTYRDVHRQFPSVVVERPRDAAGMVAPLLVSAGVLSNPASVRCPGSNMPTAPMTLDQARALPPEEFFRQAGRIIPSYAYSLGHRDEDGNYLGPVLPEGLQASAFALMSDCPPLNGLGNSTNHGGRGQWVLFADGHVRFVNLRTVGIARDDIYLNKANRVAAGLDPLDTVLGSSDAKP